MPTSTVMTSRQPACEPCRRSKLACDHARPSCSRCRRQKKGNACVYRASPFRRRQKLDLSPPCSPAHTGAPSVLLEACKIHRGLREMPWMQMSRHPTDLLDLPTRFAWRLYVSAAGCDQLLYLPDLFVAQVARTPETAKTQSQSQVSSGCKGMQVS